MDLYLIRHGQFASGKSLGRSSDSKRVNEKILNAEGIAEIERTGRALKTLNIIPDTIVTSPLRHARHNAEILDSILFANKHNTYGKTKRKNTPKSIQVWNDLAPEGDRALVCDHILRAKPHNNQSKGRLLEAVYRI
jgi:phosphohistidine phosphatase SixA